MTTEKYLVKVGCGELADKMTIAGAQRYGERHIPAELRRVGFKCVVFKTSLDIHGGVWLRINYGK